MWNIFGQRVFVLRSRGQPWGLDGPMVDVSPKTSQVNGMNRFFAILVVIIVKYSPTISNDVPASEAACFYSYLVAFDNQNTTPKGITPDSYYYQFLFMIVWGSSCMFLPLIEVQKSIVVDVYGILEWTVQYTRAYDDQINEHLFAVDKTSGCVLVVVIRACYYCINVAWSAKLDVRISSRIDVISTGLARGCTIQLNEGNLTPENEEPTNAQHYQIPRSDACAALGSNSGHVRRAKESRTSCDSDLEDNEKRQAHPDTGAVKESQELMNR
ncbi:uncharacterized protein HD556DRAFT_1538167 [Suillus plorans]|uniref:Uncharacterized protein n=1 Tax=Suillus plorans TaxID=116603 RepID=A0A9P7AIM1_9AGAM|nr:uncharacterized protein HD556DRAFT_1538167 [Suillus plorans]KAG1789643.1 hypothetical protein HD556DRAFT_1538167 [Suillus plorans]